MHDIDFDKDIICVAQFDGEIDLDNLEQIAMKETDDRVENEITLFAK